MALLDQIDVRCDSCFRYARVGGQVWRSWAGLLAACKRDWKCQELGLGDEHKRGSQWQDNTGLEYSRLNEPRAQKARKLTHQTC